MKKRKKKKDSPVPFSSNYCKLWINLFCVEVYLKAVSIKSKSQTHAFSGEITPGVPWQQGEKIVIQEHDPASAHTWWGIHQSCGSDG